MLGGALAAGHRHRVYDAVILKTLGATRGSLLGAYALEYLLLGLATALFGVLAGSLAAWLIVTELMHLGFVWLPLPALAATLGAVAVTVGLGLARHVPRRSARSPRRCCEISSALRHSAAQRRAASTALDSTPDMALSNINVVQSGHPSLRTSQGLSGAKALARTRFRQRTVTVTAVREQFKTGFCAGTRRGNFDVGFRPEHCRSRWLRRADRASRSMRACALT